MKGPAASMVGLEGRKKNERMYVKGFDEQRWHSVLGL